VPRSTIYGYLNYSIAGTADAGMVYDEIMGAQAELTAATGRYRGSSAPERPTTMTSPPRSVVHWASCP